MRYILASAAACLLGGLFLSSCQTMSKQECVAADWKSVGEADGSAGYSPQDRFADRAKDCSKVGIVPDQTAWQAGYDVGVKKYCTPMSGLNAGMSGKVYANVCPPETSDGFLRGYRLGRADYQKASAIRSLESQIRSDESQIDLLNAQVAAKKMSEADADSQKRDIRRRIRQARMDREDMQFERDRIQDDINMFSANPDQPNNRYSRYDGY